MMYKTFQPQLPPAKTIHRVVIHHADCLHMGIADSAADETEPPPLQVAAHGIGNRGAGRDFLMVLPGVLQRSAIHEAPLVGSEGTKFPLNRQEGAGVANRRFHLEAITDYAGIRKEFRNLDMIEMRHCLGVKAGKGDAVVRTFTQDGNPGKPGLGTFQDQKLEQEPVVVDWHAPFPVVIVQIKRLAADPGATDRSHVVSHCKKRGEKMILRRNRDPRTPRKQEILQVTDVLSC